MWEVLSKLYERHLRAGRRSLISLTGVAQKIVKKNDLKNGSDNAKGPYGHELLKSVL